jgi:hypothetical protein
MHTCWKKAGFLLLDVAYVLVLFSMPFCMRPMRFDFISEAIRQCLDEEHGRVLPVLLVLTNALIVLLQLDWMYSVSLHHLQHVATLDVMFTLTAAVEKRARDARDATRTRIIVRMLALQAEQHVVCVAGHSDAAFVAQFAAVVGMAGLVHWHWKSPQHLLHYYGVFLFCAGFFVMLQIVWLNLQAVSAVARLRHMPAMSGMHWLVDSGIILFLLLFLLLNFMLGQKGPIVVVSELLGFALLMFQFLYVFRACCKSGESRAVHRPAAWTPRVLVCVLLLLPFFAGTRSGRQLVN